MNREQDISTVSNNVWGKAVSQNHTTGILLEFWNHDVLVSWVVTAKVSVAQPCLTLCDPMERNPPSSSAHGILQARILEWLLVPLSRRSWPRDRTPVSHFTWFFTIWVTGKSRYLVLFHLSHREVQVPSSFPCCSFGIYHSFLNISYYIN